VIDPDPLEDLLPLDHPIEFDHLLDDERRWRLRLYLATWSMGLPDDLSWATALNGDPVHVEESMAILADGTDEAIRDAVAQRRRVETNVWWDGLLAESRRAEQTSRVTILTRSAPDRG
jgi:hypothetical protein